MALTNTLYRKFFSHKGWPVPPDGTVFGVGMRGCKLLDPDSIEVITNKPDQYNDVLGLAGADWYLWKGTVDPGKYYTEKPLNPKGAAHLADGLHWFGEGLHRGKMALVQVGGTLVWRDYDKDYTQDSSEVVHVEFGIGANWHAGGRGQLVGPNSAACANTHGGWSGVPWITTRDKAYNAIRGGRTAKPNVLAMYVMEAKELVDFSNTGSG